MKAVPIWLRVLFLGGNSTKLISFLDVFFFQPLYSSHFLLPGSKMYEWNLGHCKVRRSFFRPFGLAVKGWLTKRDQLFSQDLYRCSEYVHVFHIKSIFSLLCLDTDFKGIDLHSFPQVWNDFYIHLRRVAE